MFSPLVGVLMTVMEVVIFSGCVEANSLEGDPSESLAPPSGMSDSAKQGTEKGAFSAPAEAPGAKKVPEHPSSASPQNGSLRESSSLSPGRVGDSEGASATESNQGREKSPAKPFLPSAKAATPPEKPPPSEGKPRPIYGLPLEYHFEVPEVPERIRGPTPMPVVSKPVPSGHLPKRE